MAKVTLGPIVQSVRGSIGPITFRRIGAKNYATIRSQGPVSPGRNSGDHYALLRSITASWLHLDPHIREFWERYHALQKPLNPRTGNSLPTPYSLYTCYQSMRLHCGLTLLENSVPEPPIFSYGHLSWDGPFWQAGSTLQGYVQMYWQEEEQVSRICLLCARSTNGKKPGRFQKKIFPTREYPEGRAIQNTNWLIYQALGYPFGLDGLHQQPAPDRPYYMMSGWGVYNDLIFSVPWTLPEIRGDTFAWPVALPNVYL